MNLNIFELMIKLISREEVFENFPKISSVISVIQKQMYEWDDINLYETEEEKKEFFENYDAVSLDYPQQNFTYKTLTLNHSDLSSFTEKLSERLVMLLIESGVKELMLISHLKMNLFGNLENDYPPLAEAYHDLEQIIGNTDYREALSFSLDDLPKMINIAFWMERCDPAAPEYMYFADSENKLAFYLCKDGNVHFITFWDNLITNELLDYSGWEIVDGRCYDNFTDDGVIEGRIFKL